MRYHKDLYLKVVVVMLQQLFMDLMIAQRFGRFVDIEIMILQKPGMVGHLFGHTMQSAQLL